MWYCPWIRHWTLNCPRWLCSQCVNGDVNLPNWQNLQHLSFVVFYTMEKTCSLHSLSVCLCGLQCGFLCFSLWSLDFLNFLQVKFLPVSQFVFCLFVCLFIYLTLTSSGHPAKELVRLFMGSQCHWKMQLPSTTVPLQPSKPAPKRHLVSCVSSSLFHCFWFFFLSARIPTFSPVSQLIQWSLHLPAFVCMHESWIFSIITWTALTLEGYIATRKLTLHETDTGYWMINFWEYLQLMVTVYSWQNQGDCKELQYSKQIKNIQV